VLIAGSATLTWACDAVGVSRATGRHWRQATGGRIPRKRPVSSGLYLSLEERLQIADLYPGGAGVRAIAVGIGRSPELSIVNCATALPRPPDGRGSTRRTRPRSRPSYGGRRPKASKFDHLELVTVVQSRLCVKWSPEQISLHLAQEFPERRRCGWVPRRSTRRCMS